MENKPQLSVIVCTFNRADLLKKCILSISDQTLPAYLYEIIVVDNNSSDITRQVVDELRQSATACIRYVFEAQQGLSIARNTGIRSARGRYVAFTDDDAAAEPTWLEAIYQAFTQTTPMPDAVGGRIVPMPERPIPHWYPDRAYSMVGALDYGPKPRLLSESEQIFGGNMAFRKSLFDECGVFDEKLGLLGTQKRWSEDTEFVRCLRTTQKRVYYAPHATVYHYVPAYKISVSYIIKRNFTQGQTDAYIESVKTPDKIHTLKIFSILQTINYILPRIVYRMMQKRNKSTVEIVRLYAYRLGYQLSAMKIKLFNRR